MAPGLTDTEFAIALPVHHYPLASAPQRQASLAAEPGAAPPDKPKLLDLVRRSIRLPHFSRLREKSYTALIRRFTFCHTKRQPATLDLDEARTFLSDLAVRRKRSVSTRNQSLEAIAFRYRAVLFLHVGWIERIERAGRARRLPIIHSRKEAREVVTCLHLSAGYIIPSTGLFEVNPRYEPEITGLPFPGFHDVKTANQRAQHRVKGLQITR